MKLPTSLFNLLLFSLLTLSCGSDFYIPSQANMLVLEKKDDIKASLAFNHAQAAYSPKNHIGLKAGYVFSNVTELSSERELNMGNIGIGYFNHKVVKPIKGIKEKNMMMRPKLCLIGYEVYANISQGSFSSINSGSRTGGTIFISPESRGFRAFDANIFYPHLSSQIYWQSQTFSLQFGLRAGLLYYYDGFGVGDYTQAERVLAASLIEDTPFPNLEYDILFSKGDERLETFMQLTWNSSKNSLINTNLAFSFGMRLNIPSLIESMKR
jgi:hypothetical protein